MAGYLTTVLISVVVVGLGIVFNRWRKRRRLPPGPKGWPFIGNLLQIDPNAPQLALSSWAQQYGDIYTIHLVGDDVIILSGDDVIREATVTNSEAFADRPQLFRGSLFNIGNFDLVFGRYSQKWIKLKKVAINAMKMYGEGLLALEEVSLDTIKSFIDDIEQHKSEPFDMFDNVQTSLASIVFTISYGRNLEEHEAATILKAERDTTSLVSNVGKESELDIAPWLRFFLHYESPRLIRETRQQTRALLLPELLKRKAMFDADNIDCVADALLRYQKEAAGDPQLPDMTDLDIESIIDANIFAGISTSSSALYSLLALCVNRPDLQRHLQAEIDGTIGDRGPRLSDRAAMPYVEAAILELLRYISHVPTSIPHMTTTNVEMKGYLLPKGTRVIMNLWSLHHDLRYWDDPWEYRPERFLTPEGAIVPPGHPNRRRTMAFGGGRRICPGETLAKNRLFLLVTSLLQKFTFLPEADDKRPLTDPRQFKQGIVLYPHRYKVRAVSRDSSN